MEHQSTGYVLSALVLMTLLIPGNRVFFPLLSKGVEQVWGYIVQIGSWRHTALRDTTSGKLGEILYQLDRFRCLRYLLKVLICSFCTYSINLSFHLLLLTTLNVDQRLNVWLVVIPIVMIASWFPFSLSGFGIVEGSWAGSLVLFANMDDWTSTLDWIFYTLLSGTHDHTVRRIWFPPIDDKIPCEFTVCN